LESRVGCGFGERGVVGVEVRDRHAVAGDGLVLVVTLDLLGGLTERERDGIGRVGRDPGGRVAVHQDPGRATGDDHR